MPSPISAIEKLDESTKQWCNDAIRTLESGNGGAPGLLRDAALNLFIAGECYLVKEPQKILSKAPEKWQVRSISEIVVTKGKNAAMAIKPRRNATAAELIPVPEGSFVGRLWKTHPRYSDEADSSMRSLLELLDELLLINRLSRATAKSRLNAGILFIPDDIDNIYQTDGDFDEDSDEFAEYSGDNGGSFQEELMAAMTTPIGDESSASSVVPLIIRGPAALATSIVHIKLERAYDPMLIERGEVVLQRILAGLSVPKDVVTGLASVKYSNAVMIEESLYKAHIEPLILMIIDQLTEVFLHPYLRTKGVSEEDLSRITIWYDPSAITTKPSKSDSASEGFDKGILSEEAWRRSHGFPETDAPTSSEKAWRLAQEKGLISEPVMEALLRLYIPEIMEDTRKRELENSAPQDQEALANALGGTAPSDDTISTDTQPPTDLVEP